MDVSSEIFGITFFDKFLNNGVLSEIFDITFFDDLIMERCFLV